MFRFLLFLAVLKLVVAKFDPRKIDYCKIVCEQGVSSGCNCVEAKDRTYVTKDMQRFRQKVLNSHNEIRNSVARGDKDDFESAANMHILQYDLELEHLARCFVMRPNFTHGHDPCRQTSYCESSSMPDQNIAGTANLTWNDDLIISLISQWYQEHENLISLDKKRTIINKFHVLPSAEYRHFTQLISATAEKIGCARALIPRNPDPRRKFVLVCNYAGPPDNCAGNVIEKPVYLVGKPCSKCGDTKCNKDLGGKYEALCGVEVKAPDEAPASLPKSPDNAYSKAPGDALSEAPGVALPDAPGNALSEAPDGTATHDWIAEDDGDDTGSRNFSNKFFIVFIVIFEVLYH